MIFALIIFMPVVLAYENLYANDGTFIGNNKNPYAPNSIHNPYGQYGSQYSSQSMNNPYGQYGSPYSSSSPNNLYANPALAVPQHGGYSYKFGANPYNY